MSDTAADAPTNGAEADPKQLGEQPADLEVAEDDFEITLGARRDAASEGEEEEDDAAADDAQSSETESEDGFITGKYCSLQRFNHLHPCERDLAELMVWFGLPGGTCPQQ